MTPKSCHHVRCNSVSSINLQVSLSCKSSPRSGANLLLLSFHDSIRVDHAYILLSTKLVETALDDCITAGIKVVSILADGFAEVGDEGMVLQTRLVAKAKSADVTLIGPNSMGVVNVDNGFMCTTNAAFKAEGHLLGQLAVLSHSEAIVLCSRSGTQYRFSVISLDDEARCCVGSVGLNG